MLLLKGKSPVLLEDMRSLSCSPKCYELVPSAWSERENVIWCCGERKRDIEIFEINRGYERLVQVLDIERDEKSELHCER